MKGQIDKKRKININGVILRLESRRITIDGHPEVNYIAKIRFKNYIVILEDDSTVYEMTKRYDDREGNTLRVGNVVTCEISEGKLLKVKPLYNM
jgi:hypothetical protein